MVAGCWCATADVHNGCWCTDWSSCNWNHGQYQHVPCGVVSWIAVAQAKSKARLNTKNKTQHITTPVVNIKIIILKCVALCDQHIDQTPK